MLPAPLPVSAYLTPCFLHMPIPVPCIPVPASTACLPPTFTPLLLNFWCHQLSQAWPGRSSSHNCRFKAEGKRCKGREVSLVCLHCISQPSWEQVAAQIQLWPWGKVKAEMLLAMVWYSNLRQASPPVPPLLMGGRGQEGLFWIRINKYCILQCVILLL